MRDSARFAADEACAPYNGDNAGRRGARMSEDTADLQDVDELTFLGDLRGKQVIIKLIVSDANGQASETGMLLDWDTCNLFLQDNDRITMVRKDAIASLAEASVPG